MTSTAVTEGLQAVLAAIQEARRARRIDSLDAGHLWSNIERYYHQKQIGGGALRGYARQIATLAKVPVAAVEVWDHVYRSFPHENWRLVVGALRDGDIVQLLYRDGWHERFAKGVKLMRIGPSLDVESALDDLAGDPDPGAAAFDVALRIHSGEPLRHVAPYWNPVFAVGHAIGVLRQEAAPGAVALIWERERDSREWRRRFAFTMTSRGTVVAIHPSASGIARQPDLDAHEVFLHDPNEPEHLIKHGDGVHITGDSQYIVERSGQRWLVRPAAPARAAEARKVGTLKAASDAIRAMREAVQEDVVRARPRAGRTGKRRLMTTEEDADARGETELSEEATTPSQRAAYEEERAKRSGSGREGSAGFGYKLSWELGDAATMDSEEDRRGAAQAAGAQLRRFPSQVWNVQRRGYTVTFRSSLDLLDGRRNPISDSVGHLGGSGIVATAPLSPSAIAARDHLEDSEGGGGPPGPGDAYYSFAWNYPSVAAAKGAADVLRSSPDVIHWRRDQDHIAVKSKIPVGQIPGFPVPK
jgi:hypothetical protein